MLYVEQLLIMVLVMDGWLVCSGEYGRSMEAVETRRCVLHGGWCSSWWLVLLHGGRPSLLAQPGEAAQLMARWGPLERGGSVDSVLNMGGQWRIMGPGVVFFNFFIFLMSSWWLACSWWWCGLVDLVVYSRLPGWWSRLHGGLVEDLQK
uniref:Candidate secreted effector n=1 Tax=Meloidogyne incognita TaxID=6306 RepID=A0A914L5K0_MELIC